MKFVDDVKIWVKSGEGGKGCVSFRREKFIPRGGPDGGDGGRGGDIIFEATPRLNTLVDFRYNPHFKAENGKPGQGARKTGRAGADLVIPVPVGTLLKDPDTGEVLFDLSEAGQRVVFLQGGRGGRGNSRFATAVRKAPRFAESGGPGQERWVRLELKLLADVGLVGLPNAGKSTLLSRLTSARPKVADYPFTTLSPNLGVVYISEEESFTLADVPGLIKDAHKGSGLGIRFLKHLERTKALVHLIDSAVVAPDDPLKPFLTVRAELEHYSAELEKKPFLVALNKIDLVGSDREREELKNFFRKNGMEALCISALTGEGLQDFALRLAELLKNVSSHS
jgi:GTP-binding protein